MTALIVNQYLPWLEYMNKNKKINSESHLPSSSKILRPTAESVRKIPLLSDITDIEIQPVLKELRIEQFPRRENIIKKGSLPDSLLFLLAGQMQVVDITEDGREVGLRILTPGDFFGEIAVITGSPRTASVISLTNVVVAFMPRNLALHLFSHSPSIANKMIKLLAEKIAQDSELRGVLSIQHASKRVFALLQSMKSTRISGEDVIERLPTHQEIAIMVNTSRETVTRALIQLSRQGIIIKNSHTVTITKPAELLELSKDSSHHIS